MTTRQLQQLRKRLKKEISDFTKQKNKEWGPALLEWEKANIPYKRNAVYELVKNGTRRRGFKRFLITDFQGKFIDSTGAMFYQACGWWLGYDNVPAKWDTMTIYGVSNRAILQLSGNQKKKLVPKELAARTSAWMARTGL